VSTDILVVDDSTLSLRMLTTILTRAGFQVETAMTGEEALEKARALHPRLIFLDAILPAKNGIEVAEEIRRDADFIPQPHIVLLTGLDDKARRDIDRHSIDEVVGKPFRPQQILDIVRQVLGRSF